MGNILKHYSTLSRWEFLPATAVGILIGVFIGLDTWDYLFDLTHILILLEGLFIFFLLFNVGFMVNCWADWEVDEEYKTRLSDAVKDVGRDAVGRLVALHIIVSVLLGFHVSWISGKWELLFLVLIGTFLGVAYSVEPFRFKSKGAAHSVMAFPVFSTPGLFSYFLVTELPITEIYSMVFVLGVIGITAAHYALVLLSQSEDYPDDKAAGIVTPAVAWGLRLTIWRAFKLNLWGVIVTIMAFALFFYHASPEMPWLLILLPLLIIFQLATTSEVYKLNKTIARTRGDRKALKVLRKVMKAYPKFHGIPLGGVMLCSFFLMMSRSLGWI